MSSTKPNPGSSSSTGTSSGSPTGPGPTYLCKHCQHQTSSLPSIRAHLESQHKDKVLSDNDLIASVVYVPGSAGAAGGSGDSEPSGGSGTGSSPGASSSVPSAKARHISSFRCKGCRTSFVEEKTLLEHFETCRACQSKKRPTRRTSSKAASSSKPVQSKKVTRSAKVQKGRQVTRKKKAGATSSAQASSGANSPAAGGGGSGSSNGRNKQYHGANLDRANSPLPYCSLCDRQFFMQATYEIHLNSKEHKQVEEAYAAKQRNVTYSCELCQVEFSQKRNLKLHNRTTQHRKAKKVELMVQRIFTDEPYDDILAELNEMSPTDTESVSSTTPSDTGTPDPAAFPHKSPGSSRVDHRSKEEIAEFVKNMLEPAKKYFLPPPPTRRTYNSFTILNDIPNFVLPSSEAVLQQSSGGYLGEGGTASLPCGLTPGYDMTLDEALSLMQQTINNPLLRHHMQQPSSSAVLSARSPVMASLPATTSAQA